MPDDARRDVFDEAGTGPHRPHLTNIIYQTQDFFYQLPAAKGSPSDGAGAGEARVAHLGRVQQRQPDHAGRPIPAKTGNQDGTSLIPTVPAYVNEKTVAT
jgi:hypothetical protein